MKKSIILIVCTVWTISLFAAPTESNYATDPRTGFDSTASRESTMYTFGNEADSIHAKGIVDIARPFFATGYISNMGIARTNSMQGTWGTPIGTNMAIGMVGDIGLYNTRDEEAASISKNNSSSINFRTAFKKDNMGIHYRFANTKGGYKIENEVGVSYKSPAVFSFYSPIGIITDKTTATNAITLYAFPQIDFPVQKGPLTTLRVGVNIDIDVKSLGDVIVNSVTYKDRKDFAIGIDGGASLVWYKEKILVLAEPYGGFDYGQRNDIQADDKKRTIASPDPYAGLNIGIMIKPFADWFELRGGLLYTLKMDNSITTIEGSSAQWDYSLTTVFQATFGMGFVLAEDFLLDIHVEPISNLLESKNFGVGVSALYRF